MTESSVAFLVRQIERVRRMPTTKRIVFPEGDDARVREAVGRLKAEGLVEPIILRKDAADSSEYADIYYERRRAKEPPKGRLKRSSGIRSTEAR